MISTATFTELATAGYASQRSFSSNHATAAAAAAGPIGAAYKNKAQFYSVF
jgi:hypothetical protein